MLLDKFFRALDLAAGKEVVCAEDGFEISVDFIVLQKPFELALFARREHDLRNAEALSLFESRRDEASQSAVFDMGFIALLELVEYQIVVLIFEIEHLLIEMADRYIYIFIIRYFLVKPSDVAIYVEHGAADVGIVGKDILTEASADVYELLDTGLGKCRMCVAAPADYQDDPSRPVRVATKFVNVAKSYYASMGRDIDIIKLNGSIELAPILGLSDVIVDIVETGTTLRENGLKVVTEFMPISARFIANKASYQFKHNEMERMLTKLRAALAEQEAAK